MLLSVSWPRVSLYVGPAPNMPDRHMMATRLNTAEPRMVPSPVESRVVNVATSDVANSGAEEPAAINVAPATASDRSSWSQMTSKLSQK